MGQPEGIVLLFDLDGTLLLTGGAGRRAMEQAFQVTCGANEALRGFSFGGMTDHLIVRTALLRMGEADEPATIQAVLDAYLQLLPTEVARSESYRILPGAHALVKSLHGVPGVALGLGTGNVRRGAMCKLARGGLDGFFAFGGFGCDHEDRVELLRAGADRGAAALGRAVEDCQVVVIGDTPRDVSAALKLGARCFGVSTGGHSADELRRLGADDAFEDLTDPRVRRALLLS